MKTKKPTYEDIEVGDSVTYVTPHGNQIKGRAVMRGPAGWVLNCGGRHGTPGIADASSTVKVTKARK